jgi:hypothetical protein
MARRLGVELACAPREGAGLVNKNSSNIHESLPLADYFSRQWGTDSMAGYHDEKALS